MHTYEHNSKTSRTLFHFNSDMSGMVKVCLLDRDGGRTDEMDISGEALLDFFAEVLKRSFIAKIENMSRGELLRQDLLRAL